MGQVASALLGIKFEWTIKGAWSYEHVHTLGVGWRMKATISADHRVTDGAEAAKFMQRFKQILEDPLRLLM